MDELCGHWMPIAKTSCARKRGHAGSHQGARARARQSRQVGQWAEQNHNRAVYLRARARAYKRGVPCTITPEDIPPIPDRCPILGVKLRRGKAGEGSSPNSPSLDRRIPSLGYAPGNIWWISKRANTMKSDADPETLRAFAEWVMNMDDPDYSP